MKLLCAFSTAKDFNNDIKIIKKYFNLSNQVIFIYNTLDSKSVFITFTIPMYKELPENIISVHRKNEFNVFYTINALNEIITKLNNGVFIKNYPLDWQIYSNQLLTINKEHQINRINFKLLEKITI